MPRSASALALIALLVSACENDRRPLLESLNQPGGAPKSLRETFDFLRDARARKAYVAMRPYIDPAYREATIDMLLAVDELLAANATVLRAVERVSPQTPRNALDISDSIQDNLELFSREVSVVDERQDDPAGTGSVRIHVAGLPMPVDVQFRRLHGHWVYSPGPGAAEAVVAFRELTKTLNRIALAVAYADHMTPEQVQYEYQLRILPKLQRFREPVAVR